jgi:hypothetical protein
VRQGPVEEEKAAWVELTEGRKAVAVAATLQRSEVDDHHGGVKEKAVGWFPLEKRRATRSKAKGAWWRPALFKGSPQKGEGALWRPRNRVRGLSPNQRAMGGRHQPNRSVNA